MQTLFFVTRSGNKLRTIPIAANFESLDFSTLGFSCLHWCRPSWKVLRKRQSVKLESILKAPKDVLQASSSFWAKDLPSETMQSVEKLVCQLWCDAGTQATVVASLRLQLFTKKQVEGQRLPPTQAPRVQAIRRDQFQALDISSSEGIQMEFGWKCIPICIHIFATSSRSCCATRKAWLQKSQTTH